MYFGRVDASVLFDIENATSQAVGTTLEIVADRLTGGIAVLRCLTSIAFFLQEGKD